ncbi:hypothetical protein PR202_gb16423 [Eleusine coracana subsp. coracana]|uniref:non-specific serine/threonine protein kinase n=1 Tax=Eleusine coracana subsp. coracana TaxID=191504 RepID=A0AAV5EY33_ELECO|nr:hypothetical protein PR202_gb16423 [Eleusine coracana subsp. coracana]
MRDGGKGYDPATAFLITALCAASAALLLLVDGAKGDEDEFPTLLINGFTATHAAGSPSPFEPVLYAPNRAFAFGFLRVGPGSLDLAVVHLPSSLPLWRATPARLGDWSRPATLSFDTTLVLTTAGGPDTTVLWQTLNAAGDTVALLNSSNLVVRRYARPFPSWQSFDYPADTLVAGQNFTAASPPLISSNRRFALRLGASFIALHMEFYGGRARSPAYWRHSALEEPPAAGNATVYGRLDGRGFFGMYLDGDGGERRVDVLSFDTFAEANLAGALFRRMTLDDDGNLRAYYWADGGGGSTKAWTAEYEAISSGRCGLPTACGAYGLCVPGDEAQCQCLTADTTSPPCHAGGDDEETAADLCDHVDAELDVVRRTRVSVAYKEQLPPFATNTTAAKCEAACAGNCSCWGALYGGASGYCYLIDFPVETMVYDADDAKVGYFKVRKVQSQTRRRGMAPGVKAVLAVVLVGLVGAGAYVGYRMWERKRRRRGEGMMVQELGTGPYKDLKSMASSNNSFKA